MDFDRPGRQIVEANFEGDTLSFDTGLMLLSQVDHRIGVPAAISSALVLELHFPRAFGRLQMEQSELVKYRAPSRERLLVFAARRATQKMGPLVSYQQRAPEGGRCRREFFHKLSALSRAIKEPDEETGVQCFVLVRRITPPPRAGKLLLEHVPHIFVAIQHARDSVKTSANGYHGQLPAALPDRITHARVRPSWRCVARKIQSSRFGRPATSAQS